MVNGIHTKLWFLIVLPFSFHRVQKQNLSGLKITCGSTRHESGMLSGSQGWTFTRVATDQSQSCWGWRPAPQQPFTENNKITHKHSFNYVVTLVALVWGYTFQATLFIYFYLSALNLVVVYSSCYCESLFPKFSEIHHSSVRQWIK